MAKTLLALLGLVLFSVSRTSAAEEPIKFILLCASKTTNGAVEQGVPDFFLAKLCEKIGLEIYKHQGFEPADTIFAAACGLSVAITNRTDASNARSYDAQWLGQKGGSAPAELGALTKQAYTPESSAEHVRTLSQRTVDLGREFCNATQQ